MSLVKYFLKSIFLNYGSSFDFSHCPNSLQDYGPSIFDGKSEAKQNRELKRILPDSRAGQQLSSIRLLCILPPFSTFVNIDFDPLHSFINYSHHLPGGP